MKALNNDRKCRAETLLARVGRLGLALVLTIGVSVLLTACGTLAAPAGSTSTVPPSVSPTRQVTADPAYWPTSGWRTSTPEEQGIDSGQLLRALRHVEEENINVRSITVIRNGYIVLEVYRQPFTAEQQYPLFSVTKSVTGALTGIAINEGYIKGVKEPVLGYFPGRTIANRDDNKEAITIEDLLTMRPGLNCADRDIGYVVEGSKDWVQYILDMPMAAPSGQKFAYCTSGPHLLSAILTSSTGMTTAEYAQSRLFGPLGIAQSDVTWAADPQGVTIGGYGISMKTRDMAKLGLLYLYEGRWGDNQVVPEEWVDASTAVHSTERPGKNYGYLMWVYPDHPAYFAAEGLGSQVVQVVKDRNMVVVMTAAIEDKQDQTVRALLQDYIIPAAGSTDTLPANHDALAALKAKVEELANPLKPVPPLKAVARRIAGKTIVMEENNPAGLTEVSAAFVDGSPEVRVDGVGPDGNRAQIIIGLDNVYRQTLDDPTWRRGWWEDDLTFVVRDLNTSSIEEGESRLHFVGDQVEVHSEEMVLGRYSFDYKGVIK